MYEEWQLLTQTLAKAPFGAQIAGISVLAGCLVVGLVASGLSRPWRNRLLPHLRLTGTMVLLALAAGIYGAGLVLLKGDWQPPQDSLIKAWERVCQTLVVLAVGLLAYRLVDAIVFYLNSHSAQPQDGAHWRATPLARRTLQIFILALTILFIGQNIFQWQISALLAGLGIGGLAVALAAQQTLSNLFGSITIFADRPFQLKDTIRIKGIQGVVEDVGFRSTRLRTAEGHLVTIPNALVAGEVVESLGYRQGLHQEMTLALKNTTPPEKLQRVVEGINQLLRQRQEYLVSCPAPQALLRAINLGNCTIVITYGFNSTDPNLFWQFNHQFQIELLALLVQEEVDLA